MMMRIVPSTFVPPFIFLSSVGGVTSVAQGGCGGRREFRTATRRGFVNEHSQAGHVPAMLMRPGSSEISAQEPPHDQGFSFSGRSSRRGLCG